MASLYPRRCGWQNRAILPAQRPLKASRICPNLENSTAFQTIISLGSKERKRKTYPRIMLVCINAFPKWLTLKLTPAGEQWRVYSGCRARESKRRCLIIQDKKDKISKWYERDILKQLQSLNGKPAAWPFEGIFLKFFLQAISWHRMAFYVGFI